MNRTASVIRGAESRKGLFEKVVAQKLGHLSQQIRRQYSQLLFIERRNQTIDLLACEGIPIAKHQEPTFGWLRCHVFKASSQKVGHHLVGSVGIPGPTLPMDRLRHLAGVMRPKS